MVKSLLTIGRLFVTVPAFEFAGAALIVAGVFDLAGSGWASVAAGVLSLLKSFDLALTRAK